MRSLSLGLRVILITLACLLALAGYTGRELLRLRRETNTIIVEGQQLDTIIKYSEYRLRQIDLCYRLLGTGITFGDATFEEICFVRADSLQKDTTWL